MAKTCTKTPVTEKVVGGKLAEKVVWRVGNCQKRIGSGLLLLAKKGTQSVVKRMVTLVHRFQKGITLVPPLFCACASRELVDDALYGGKEVVVAGGRRRGGET